MATGSLQTDPLFKALTRPTMFFGVSFYFCIINGLSCMVYFIQSSSFYAFILLFGNHLIGYLICFKEPLFIELYLIKSQKCTRCQNKMYHGANSYDLY